MTVIGEVFVAVRPQDKAFERELQQNVVPAGQRVAKTLATALGGAFVVQGLKNFVTTGIQGLNDAAVVAAQTTAAIKSTGGAANVSAAQVTELATAKHKMSGVDDEIIQKGANLLLTFTGVRNEVGKGNDIFNQATTAALDLSRAGFGSVESAAVLMGKALNDPVQGLTALQRVGVRLTDDQKALVKELVATGDTLGAQKVILEEVNRQVGGSAEAYGKTLPGQLQIAQTSLDTMRESLVAGMVPALRIGAEATTFLTEQFGKQPAALQAVEGGLLLVVGGLASIITPLKSGIDLWRSFGDGAKAAAAAQQVAGATSAASAAQVGQVGTAAANSSSSVAGLYTTTGRLSGAMKVLGAVAAVGAVAGLAALANSVPQVEGDMGRLADATRDMTDAQLAQVGQNLVVAAGWGELDTVIRQAADANALGADRLIDAAEAAGLGADEVARLRDITEGKRHTDVNATLDSERYTAQQQAATDAARDGVPVTEALAGAVGGVGTASADSAPGVDDLAGATDGLGTATAEASDELTVYDRQLQAARDAVDALFTTTEGAIDADFRYRDAKDSVADALGKLTELQKEGKGKTDEYRRASDDAEEALYRQSQAAAEAAVQNYELAGVTLDAADKAAIQKAELERLRDTLAPGSPLRTRLQGMIDKLGEVPAKKSVTVDVLVSGAVATIDAFISRYRNAVLDLQLQVNTGAGRIFRAGGGPVPQYLQLGGGPRGTDTIPAWLTPGEFVMQRAAVNYWGISAMERLNRGEAPGRSEGIVLQFQPGSVVIPGGTSPAEARRLGRELGDGAAERLAERHLAVHARTL